MRRRALAGVIAISAAAASGTGPVPAAGLPQAQLPDGGKLAGALEHSTAVARDLPRAQDGSASPVAPKLPDVKDVVDRLPKLPPADNGAGQSARPERSGPVRELIRSLRPGDGGEGNANGGSGAGNSGGKGQQGRGPDRRFSDTGGGGSWPPDRGDGVTVDPFDPGHRDTGSRRRSSDGGRGDRSRRDPRPRQDGRRPRDRPAVDVIGPPPLALTPPATRIGAPVAAAADEPGSRPQSSGIGTAAVDTVPPSPAQRIVEQIVEVVPAPLRLALAALTGLAVLLAGMSFLQSRRARALERQRQQLLDDVGLLQTALLPRVGDRVGPAAVSVAYRPAEGLAAGGDFYDVLDLGDGKVGVLIGDVSGHGREALSRTTLLHYTLRAYLQAGLAPRVALQMAGDTLDDQLGDQYATVVLAVYDAQAGHVTYSCAGHPPPIITGADHQSFTMVSSPPIGWGMRTGLRQTQVPLGDGARLCLYTDGLTEARLDDGALLGEDRLRRHLLQLQRLSAGELLEQVRTTAARTPDDMAVCLLEAATPSAAPAAQIEELDLGGDDLELLDQLLERAGFDERARVDAQEHAGRALADHGRIVAQVNVTDRRLTFEPAAAVTLTAVSL